MAKGQPKFSPEQFSASLDELGQVERPARLIDVLLEYRDKIIQRLSEARHDKEIYEALKESGYTISYPGFQRAMKQFRQVLQLPSRREARLQALHSGRFLRGAAKADFSQTPRLVPAPLKKGKLELLNTEHPLKAAARQL